MLSLPDFEEKQILFINSYAHNIRFRNGNIVFCDEKGKVIDQASCYKIFCIFIFGETTLSSVVIDKLHEFGIMLFLLHKNLKVYAVIGGETEGNVLLRRQQYEMPQAQALELSKHIVNNKIQNQLALLKTIRKKPPELKEVIKDLKKLVKSVAVCDDRQALLGIEGSASKCFFHQYFNEANWYKRLPRTKCDPLNTLLDIGYTYLFNFVDAHLRLYGFDTYMGVYHQVFYARKSLVCDHTEPFRCIIDQALIKAFHLGQIDAKDFRQYKGQFQLKYDHAAKYSKVFLQALMEHKTAIFLYFQAYYRAIARGEPQYPSFLIEKC